MIKKKTILTTLMVLIAVFSGLFLQHTAKAEETVAKLEITAYPSKTTYMSGEELDLSDMVLTAVNTDGTKQVIADYRTEGYDNSKLGDQVVWIKYQSGMTSLMITVIPARVTNITQEDLNKDYITLTWKPVAGAYGYEVYSVGDNGYQSYIDISTSNRIVINDSSAVPHTYKVRAVYNTYGLSSYGEFSELYTTVKTPPTVTGLKVTATAVSSVTLAWDGLSNVTGYFIYRAPATSDKFTYIATSATASYTDTKAASGTGFRYKVCAYIHKDIYKGDFSQVVGTSTLPASPVLKYKAGDQKIRLTWKKITGASSYDIYIGDDVAGYTLLATNQGNENITFLAEKLKKDHTYTFYAVAKREYEGKVYESPASAKIKVQLVPIPDTSTEPKYYADQAAFKASQAYKSLEFFRKNVNYSKSIIIPGLINTNIDGFTSTRMCPQGITFAGDYLLLTAYDMASEENTVIYVMDKGTGTLKSTLILPVKAHAGGIVYDGTYVWVAVGTKVSAIPFTEIIAAAENGMPYTKISFIKTNKIGIAASYMTYYDDRLWVGSYDEQKPTKLYCYYVHDEDGELSLVEEGNIDMPNRVQGIVFTEDGYMILSRSCQLYKGLRGYMRQLDIYRPNLTEIFDGVHPLGDILHTIEMPSMNEEMALDGDYLYVNFESAAFANASYIVDRICAFPLDSILKK